jgi:hypothetical protein
MKGEVDVGLCDAFGVEAFEDLPEAVRDVDLAVLFIAGRNSARKLVFASPNLCFDDAETNSRPWTPTPNGQRSEISNTRREMLRHHLLLQNSVKRHVEDINIRMRCESLIEDIVYKLSEIDEQGYTASSIGQGGRGYERPRTLGRPQTSKYEWVWNMIPFKFIMNSNSNSQRNNKNAFEFRKRGSSARIVPESVEDIFPPNPQATDDEAAAEITPIKQVKRKSVTNNNHHPKEEGGGGGKRSSGIGGGMEVEDISEQAESHLSNFESGAANTSNSERPSHVNNSNNNSHNNDGGESVSSSLSRKLGSIKEGTGPSAARRVSFSDDPVPPVRPASPVSPAV